MKCLRQEVGASRDENRASHGCRQPFVCIDGHGVGALDTVQQAAQAIRRQHRTAPCRVHVQPQCLLFRDVGAGMQRVDHAGPGGSGGRNDHDGNCPSGTILGNGLEQRLRVHPPAAVGGYELERAAADAGLMRNFQPGDVAVPRCIKCRRSGEGAHAVGGKFRMRCCQRTDQRGVVRFGAAGRKMSGRIVAEGGAAGHGLDHMTFQRYGDGRGR